MGLEAPLALLGLLGVLIPLVVHRMRNRELPHVVLPTFHLLTRALARTQYKRVFTDLLLLLLRIGVIALAAFALAAPYVRARLSFGDGRLTNLAIVIDDSLSMARDDSGTPLIEKARTRALEVIRTLPEGSEVAIVLGGKPARVLSPLSRDLSGASRALERARLSAVRVNDLSQSIELALRQQSRGLVSPRRLLVLSDFARHAALDAKVLPLDSAALSFERVGAAPSKPNLYIAEYHTSIDPTRPNEISIAVEVRAAYGGLPPSPIEARAEVELNGRVESSVALTFDRGAAKVTMHAPAPLGSDIAQARLRVVADDALAADNQVSIVLGDGDAVKLLLVNGDPRPANRSDELYYVTRALALIPEAELSLRVQTVDALSLEHAELGASDVVLLANVPAPSAALAKRLETFVQNGGGLIVSAGSRIEAAPYNSALGTLLPSHIRGSAHVEAQHFALGPHAGWLPEGLLGLREARSRERLVLEPTPQLDTLLVFDDGLPALVEKSFGEGRCLLLATTLDADFSDLPLRPGYLPLLGALIREAAGATAAARSDVAPGERVALPAPRDGRFVEVRAPDGSVQRFAPSHGAAPTFDTTDALGVFEIRTGEENVTPKLRATFVVSPPRDESDLTPGPLPAAGTNPQASTAPPATIHVPFTPWLWLSVFALIALEGVARVRKRWAGSDRAAA